MRAFTCPRCGNGAYFDNAVCAHCAAEIGFRWPERELWLVAGGSFRCANATLAACNWVVPAAGELCASCVLTRTRPSDDDPTGLDEFRDAEGAKRHLLFELGELGLGIDGGLTFELLSSEREQVTTGHAGGVITLDLAESDPVHRETVREQLNEPSRTLLGHFRHEVGHYFQPLIVPEGPPMERCRELFGDERADYQAALDRHYAQGPPPDWADRHVSAYAAMHPMEDWAETFAHVLHVRDTMQTAAAQGLTDADPGVPMRELLSAWLPLSIALNEINRSMGRSDVYPFVLSAPVVEKMAFVDERIRTAAAA